MDEAMDSAEFTQWMAYANKEPFGYPLLMFMFSVQTAELINAISRTIPMAKNAKRPTVKASDFYPQEKGTPKPSERMKAYRNRRAKRNKVRD